MKVSPYSRNIPKIYFINFSWMFLVIMPIVIPFFKSHQLSMEKIYILQSIFSITAAVCEVPSGYIADVFGRKFSLFMGSLFHAIGFTGFIIVDDFLFFALFHALMGVANSLFSGTDIALLYDSIEVDKNESLEDKSSQTKLMGNRLFYMQMGETIAAILGGLLAAISISLTVKVNAIISWVPLFVVMTISEPPRKRMSRREHFLNFKNIYNKVLKENSFLKLIFINNILFGLSTLIAVWAFQDYWQKIGISLIHFGYLWALSNFVVAATAKLTHRIHNKVGSLTPLLLISLLPVVGYLGMSLTLSVFGVLFCLLFKVSRGFNQVILKDAINIRVSSDMRATANSISNLGVRLLFCFLGPLMGFLLDRHGHQSAFGFFSLFYLMVFIIFTVPMLKKHTLLLKK